MWIFSGGRRWVSRRVGLVSYPHRSRDPHGLNKGGWQNLQTLEHRLKRLEQVLVRKRARFPKAGRSLTCLRFKPER